MPNFNTLARLIQKRIFGNKQQKSYIFPIDHISTDRFKRMFYTREELEALSEIYESGGIAAKIVETYGLYVTARGWTIESNKDIIGSDEIAEKVRKYLDNAKIDRWLRYIINQSFLYGFGVCEVTWEDDIPTHVYMLDASEFEIVMDEYGNILSYRQHVGGGSRDKIDMLPEDIIKINAIESYSPYGISVIHRSMEDIKRDDRISESIAVGFERHGTPKWHHKVDVSNALDPRTDLENYKMGVKGITAKKDVVTTSNVDITNVDSGSVDYKIDTEFSLARMCASTGMPAELIGLRLGTTDNTAVSRIESFKYEIDAYKATIAAQLTEQLVNRIVGAPDVCYFKFKSTSATEDSNTVDIITKLMGANPSNPLWIGEDWIRSKLEIEGINQI